jgi:hypothetical protein
MQSFVRFILPIKSVIDLLARELLTSPITIAVVVVNRTNTHVYERINEFVEKEEEKGEEMMMS